MRLLLTAALCCTFVVLAASAGLAEEKPGWEQRPPKPAAQCGGVPMQPSDLCDGTVVLGLNPTMIVEGDTSNLANDYDVGAGNTCTEYQSTGPDGAYFVQLAELCSIDIIYDECPPGPPDVFDRSLYFVEDCNNPVATCLCGSDMTFPGGTEGPEACSYTNAGPGLVNGFIVVDGFSDTSAGAYTLDVTTECQSTPVEESTWGSVKATYN